MLITNTVFNIIGKNVKANREIFSKAKVTTHPK